MSENERRIAKRYFLELPGKIYHEKTSSAITVNNISRTGAEITSPLQFPIGDIFNISLQLGDSVLLQADCKIIWTLSINTGYKTGIKFLEISEHEIQTILFRAGIAATEDEPVFENPHLETFETIFESYHDEIFLRRTSEFTDYIKEQDPDKSEWAETLFYKMKEVINSTKKSFEDWAKSKWHNP